MRLARPAALIIHTAAVVSVPSRDTTRTERRA